MGGPAGSEKAARRAVYLSNPAGGPDAKRSFGKFGKVLGSPGFYYGAMFPIGAEKAESEQNRRLIALIALVGKGDVNALSDLYDETSTVIFSLLLKILEDERLSEETLVDVYNRIRGGAAKFDPDKTTPLVWMMGLGRELALARSKGQRASHILAALSEGERCILQLAWFGGFTVDEIASLLGVSRRDVAGQITCAMKKLRLTPTTR